MDTETASAAAVGFDTWDDAAILDALCGSQERALQAVRQSLPAIAEAASLARRALAETGRIAYAGAGTSGRIACQDAAELGPTFGVPAERLAMLMAGGPGAMTESVEGAEDDTVAARDAVEERGIGPGDVLLGVAASGRTPFTLACVSKARARGAFTIGVANVAGAPLLDAADHPILLASGPEIVAGSTRLAAGTAQKIALNLFSTLLMTRLGHVHDGRMVDMRLSNAKLRQRAVDMVGDLAHCDADIAQEALHRCGGVKPAVLVARGLEPDAAAALLARHRGVLRAALAELAP